MKKQFLIILSVLILTSCGTSKRSYYNQGAQTSNSKNTMDPRMDKLKNVINLAKSFEGTPYKFGGTTSKGMDCSGLIYTCYLKEDLKLPRTSSAMSEFGKKIKPREINVGDLVFFETDKTRRKINHVGLVVDKTSDKIFFIHSTSSRGVIISSLDDVYWTDSFVMARRVL